MKTAIRYPSHNKQTYQRTGTPPHPPPLHKQSCMHRHVCINPRPYRRSWVSGAEEDRSPPAVTHRLSW